MGLHYSCYNYQPSFVHHSPNMVYSIYNSQWLQAEVRSANRSNRTVTVRFDINSRETIIHPSSGCIVPIQKKNLYLKKGSYCSIFSISEWCQGIVIDIKKDHFDEWLTIQYKDEEGHLSKCKIRRHSHFLKYKSRDDINPKVLVSNGMMPEMKAILSWIRLHDILITSKVADIIKINNHQLLLFTATGQAIHIFDMYTLQWTIFCDYGTINNTIHNHALVRVVYDSNDDNLYIFHLNSSGNSKRRDLSIIYNFMTSIKHINSDTSMYTVFKNAIRANEISTNSVVVPHKGEMHLIERRKHTILRQTHDDIEQRLLSCNYIMFHVHIPSYKLLLVMMVSEDKQLRLLQYAFETKLWTSIEYGDYKEFSRMIPWQMTAAMSKDENYIFIVPKKSQARLRHVNQLWLMKIEIVGDKSCHHDCMIKCAWIRACNHQLPCPSQSKGGYDMIRQLIIMDESERIGKCVLNKFLNNLNMLRLVPMDVVRMILYFYEMQWLHLLYFGKGISKIKHYVMPLDNVLNCD